MSVSYGQQPILNRVSGCFKPGTFTAIVGPNGGGKSTLLKTIMGMIPILEGQLIPGVSEARKHCAYLPQVSNIDRQFPLTVSDVVSLGLCPERGLFRSLGAKSSEQVQEALNSVGMYDYRETLLSQLSGGQVQRVLFARLSLQKASVILLDEPFSAIDRHTTEDLLALAKSWHEAGKTVIAVLHNYDLVKQFFPQTMMIARGVVAWDDTNKALTEENLNRARELSNAWGGPEFQTARAI